MTTQDESNAIAIKVRFEGAEAIPILYASNAFVRFDEHVFLISFAQVHGPYEVQPNVAELQSSGVSGQIVARLAIPPNRWKEMLTIFQDNYEKWELRQRIMETGMKEAGHP